MVREIPYPHTDGAFLYAAVFANTDTVFAGGSGTNRAEVMEVSTDRVGFTAVEVSLRLVLAKDCFHCIMSVSDEDILGPWASEMVVLSTSGNARLQ